jgi:hypothetical protein
MARKGRSGDLKYVAMLQALIAEGATMAEKGKVALEALMSGWEVATLARAIGVHHKAVQKWLAAAKSNSNDDLDRGRPSELLPSHKAVLMRLASNPATAHLPAKVLWQFYLQEFECSPECQASDNCPHETVSYYTALRFLQSLPSAYREGKLRLRKRFRASHTSLVPPGMVWLADRSKSDIQLMRDEWKGEVARYEIGAFVDQGTMTVLAIAAVERQVDGKFSPFFDAAAFNALFADALLGELTGIQAKPKVFVVDWGKVENNQALEKVCKKLRISVQHARPYDPGSKPQVEALFNFIHHQLEAYLPGYLGSLNRPDSRPPTTESGKLRKEIDMKTGEVYWVDDSGRRILSVREFNQLLKEWARKWNAQMCQHWNGRRLELFQAKANRTELNEEMLRVMLLPSVSRKPRTDGEIFWGQYRWWNYGTAIMAAFGDTRKVILYVAPDLRAWVFLNDEPIGGDLEAARAIEVPCWRYIEDSETAQCWTEFKRAMVRRIKQIVEQAKREGEWVDDVILKYRDEFVAQVNAFLANPQTFLPYRPAKPVDLEEEPEMSWEEQMEVLHIFAEQQRKEIEEALRKRREEENPFAGFWWIQNDEEKEANNHASVDGQPSNL